MDNFMESINLAIKYLHEMKKTHQFLPKDGVIGYEKAISDLEQLLDDAMDAIHQDSDVR